MLLLQVPYHTPTAWFDPGFCCLDRLLLVQSGVRHNDNPVNNSTRTAATGALWRVMALRAAELVD
jgi:hypothetical protein